MLAKAAASYALTVRRNNMNIHITPEDDPVFVRIIESITNSLVLDISPQIVVIIQIDNWFDHKWLDFSGKILGALGIWRKELTIPPFNPNRVKNQIVYKLGESGNYIEQEATLLHTLQKSSENLNHKLKNATDSGLFFWWSSNTKTNSQGSLMVYSQIDDKSSSWFVAFDRKTEWSINKTEGIPVKVIKQYINYV